MLDKDIGLFRIIFLEDNGVWEIKSYVNLLCGLGFL